MKYVYNILLILSTVFFFACQADEELAQGAKTGYLRLSVSEDASTTTRAVPENYKPEQIAVKIVDANGGTIESTEDWELWKDEPIELPVGTYTIQASSNGFDGKDTGFDIPYYAGSKEVVIEADKEVNETITCTLANVKVTSTIDAELLSKAKSVTVQVKNTEGGYAPINFVSSETRSAYFPVTDLQVAVTVTNQEGEQNTMDQTLKNVKARDHYKLNIRLQPTGSNDITVVVDPTTHEYSYTFYVATEPTNGATLNAGAWDRLAYLTAKDIMVESTDLMEGIKFQYRTTDSDPEEGWVDVTPTEKDGKYTAFATGLKASTEYYYRLVSGNNTVIQEGTNLKFTTSAADAKTPLQNGGFEEWCVISTKPLFLPAQNTAYPNASGDVVYWDTSNPGANVMGQLDPTQSVTSPIRPGSEGTLAVQLKSQVVSGIAFAAASLYIGSFGSASLSGSATVNFGHSFSSRPIALHGYYQYAPKAIDNVDSGKLEEGGLTINKGDMDECSIYIALATEVISVNNADISSLLSSEKIKSDSRIIAYGELPSGAATNETANNGYKEFTIPLQYKEDKFTETPTHIIVVCSASKYGDYMTGGAGSTLYVDDFSLIYDGEPQIWDLSANN